MKIYYLIKDMSSDDDIDAIALSIEAFKPNLTSKSVVVSLDISEKERIPIVDCLDDLEGRNYEFCYGNPCRHYQLWELLSKSNYEQFHAMVVLGFIDGSDIKEAIPCYDIDENEFIISINDPAQKNEVVAKLLEIMDGADIDFNDK